MKIDQSRRWLAMWACSLVCSVLGLICLIVAIATNAWIVVNVNRDPLSKLTSTNHALRQFLLSDPLYYSRSRGLFIICYEKVNVSELNLGNISVSTSCVKETGYQARQGEDPGDWRQHYSLHMHLQRCLVALFVISIFLIIIAIGTTVVGYITGKASVLKVIGPLSFGGVILIVGGMAMFNGVTFIEDNRLFLDGFYYKWRNQIEHKDLNLYSSKSYGYSYGLGWAAGAFTALAAIFASIMTSLPFVTEDLEKVPIASRSRNNSTRASSFGTGGSIYANSEASSFYRPTSQRNRAYDYIEGKDDDIGV